MACAAAACGMRMIMLHPDTQAAGGPWGQGRQGRRTLVLGQSSLSKRQPGKSTRGAETTGSMRPAPHACQAWNQATARVALQKAGHGRLGWPWRHPACRASRRRNPRRRPGAADWRVNDCARPGDACGGTCSSTCTALMPNPPQAHGSPGDSCVRALPCAASPIPATLPPSHRASNLRPDGSSPRPLHGRQQIARNRAHVRSLAQQLARGPDFPNHRAPSNPQVSRTGTAPRRLASACRRDALHCCSRTETMSAPAATVIPPRSDAQAGPVKVSAGCCRLKLPYHSHVQAGTACTVPAGSCRAPQLPCHSDLTGKLALQIACGLLPARPGRRTEPRRGRSSRRDVQGPHLGHLCLANRGPPTQACHPRRRACARAAGLAAHAAHSQARERWHRGPHTPAGQLTSCASADRELPSPCKQKTAATKNDDPHARARPASREAFRTSCRRPPKAPASAATSSKTPPSGCGAPRPAPMKPACPASASAAPPAAAPPVGPTACSPESAAWGCRGLHACAAPPWPRCWRGPP